MKTKSLQEQIVEIQHKWKELLPEEKCDFVCRFQSELSLTKHIKKNSEICENA